MQELSKAVKNIKPNFFGGSSLLDALRKEGVIKALADAGYKPKTYVENRGFFGQWTEEKSEKAALPKTDQLGVVSDASAKWHT